jgi:hypothetical protein
MPILCRQSLGVTGDLLLLETLVVPDRKHVAAAKRAELAKIERQLQKLLDALLDDGDSKTIVKNMQTLEARQELLEVELPQADSPPPLLHPNMAEVYHRKINELHAALTSDDTKTEAAEILRTLIDAIILAPEDSEL